MTPASREKLRALAATPKIVSDDRAHEATEIAINIVGNIRSRDDHDDDGFELTGEEAAERILAVMSVAQDELDPLRGAVIELLDEDERKEQAMADAYQAVSCLIDLAGMADHPEAIRILDVLAYGKTEDGVDLLPWPKDQAIRERLRVAVGATHTRRAAVKHRRFRYAYVSMIGIVSAMMAATGAAFNFHFGNAGLGWTLGTLGALNLGAAMWGLFQ